MEEFPCPIAPPTDWMSYLKWRCREREWRASSGASPPQGCRRRCCPSRAASTSAAPPRARDSPFRSRRSGTALEDAELLSLIFCLSGYPSLVLLPLARKYVLGGLKCSDVYLKTSLPPGTQMWGTERSTEPSLIIRNGNANPAS